MIVAEAVLNVACAGARALALVNCLNFGNPEHPVVMWQLSEAIDGLAEACAALDVPVVGGNVSLYNESRGRDIEPTPVVGVLGVIESLVRRPPGVRLVDGHRVLLVGETQPVLGGSAWAWTCRGHRSGSLPSLDLQKHRAVVELIAGLVADGLVSGVHDVSDGGLGLALAEMAVRSGTGFRVGGVAGHVELFSESPSRVVMTAADAAVAEIVRRADAAGVVVGELGRAGGDRLVVEGLVDAHLGDAATAWRDPLPQAVGEAGPASLG